MKHKVYMRDWYFNAGIVGFLRVISDNAIPEDLDKIEGLTIGDNGNFIEFDDVLLKNFRIKFLKYAFLMLVNLDIYKNKYLSLIKQIDDKEGKLTVKKITSQLSSSYERFTKDILNKDFTSIKSVDQLKKELTDAADLTKSLNIIKLFDQLLQSETGKAYINWFLDGWQLKGFVSTANFEKYIQQVVNIDPDKKLKNNDICLSCHTLKAENEFNNSISNIIGFNKDNSNWIWGFKSTNMKLCGLCSLIYSSALLAMVKLNKYVNENRVDCYYFLNRNSNIKQLYQSIQLFQKTLHETDVTKKSFSQIIKETIINILKKQSGSVLENINFIEMIENPILAGQSSKGYNVYNYNISTTIADFLNNKLKNEESIPKGYYKIRDGSYSITDELIAKTIQHQLGYGDLLKYYEYFISNSTISVYNLYSISSYIFDYINIIIGKGGTMEENKTVIRKAYRNGLELRDKIYDKNRVNQIDGIVYSLLNDLKIANKEGFLDKYIRLMMSNGLDARFGSSGEMEDSDKFLQFGYSFINGLLSKPKDTNNQEQKGV